MLRSTRFAAILLIPLTSGAWGQSTTPPPPSDSATESNPQLPAAPPSDSTTDGEAEGGNANSEMTDEDISIGEIPAVETVELTMDATKRALDAYELVRNKYKDADLESYEDLQAFVDQAKDGKAFEADIKAAGFSNVNEWNLVITTASFAYANIVDDQTEEIKQQIEEIKNDTEMAEDMKARMTASLKAMIPSENNQKIIEVLLNDTAYTDRIKTLEIEEE
jgi:hypothetical protein